MNEIYVDLLNQENKKKEIEINPLEYRTINAEYQPNANLDEIDKEDALVPIELIRQADELEIYLDSWEAYESVDKEALAEAVIDDPEELDIFGQSVAFIVDQISKLTDEERTGRDFSALLTTYQNLLAVTEGAYHKDKYGTQTNKLDLHLPTLEDFIATNELDAFLGFCQAFDLVTTDYLQELLSDEQDELIYLTHETVIHYTDILNELPESQKSNYDFSNINKSRENLTNFVNSVKRKS